MNLTSSSNLDSYGDKGTRHRTSGFCFYLDSTPIYFDSETAIATKSPIFHDRAKHIEAQYHYVRERTQAKEARLVYVTS